MDNVPLLDNDERPARRSPEGQASWIDRLVAERDAAPQTLPDGSINREWARVTCQLADAYLEKKLYRDAEDLIRPLVQPDGALYHDAIAHTVYAKVLILSGRPDHAVDHLKPLVSAGGIFEQDRRMATTFAKALLENRELRNAILFLEDRIKDNGFLAEHSGALALLCKIYYCSGKAYKGIALLRPHAENPQSPLSREPTILTALAKAYIENNEPAETLRLLLPNLEKGMPLENDPTAFKLVVRAYVDNAEPEKALAILNTPPRTRTALWQDQDLSFLQARCALALGKPEDVLTIMAPFVKDGPQTEPQIMSLLVWGCAQCMLGKKDEAMQTIIASMHMHASSRSKVGKYMGLLLTLFDTKEPRIQGELTLAKNKFNVHFLTHAIDLSQKYAMTLNPKLNPVLNKPLRRPLFPKAAPLANAQL